MSVGGLSFHHVQLYADSLRSLDYYSVLQDNLDELTETFQLSDSNRLIHDAKLRWNDISEHQPIMDPYGRDIVEQLLVGLGWRITAFQEGQSTAN